MTDGSRAATPLAVANKKDHGKITARSGVRGDLEIGTLAQVHSRFAIGCPDFGWRIE
jgi:hypothetical protein